MTENEPALEATDDDIADFKMVFDRYGIDHEVGFGLIAAATKAMQAGVSPEEILNGMRALASPATTTPAR